MGRGGAPLPDGATAFVCSQVWRLSRERLVCGSAPLRKSLREECAYLSECFPPRLPTRQKPLPSMESARGPRRWPKLHSLRSSSQRAAGGTQATWVSSPLPPAWGREDEKSRSQSRGERSLPVALKVFQGPRVKSTDRNLGAELIRPDPDQRRSSRQSRDPDSPPEKSSSDELSLRVKARLESQGPGPEGRCP